MLLVTPFYGVSEMETGERGEYLPMLLWLGLVACLVIVSGLRMGEVRWPPIVMEMLSDDGRAADLDSRGRVGS